MATLCSLPRRLVQFGPRESGFQDNVHGTTRYRQFRAAGNSRGNGVHTRVEEFSTGFFCNRLVASRDPGFSAAGRCLRAPKCIQVSSEFPFYDEDNAVLTAFVQNYFEDGSKSEEFTFGRDNLASAVFNLNPDHTIEKMSGELEAFREAFIDLCAIPMAGEMRHPLLLAHHQVWCSYVARTSFDSLSWAHRLTPSFIIHTYLRITPPELQTWRHKRLLYAVATAVDWATSSTLIPDDIFDGSETRNGVPPWHHRHPMSSYNDTSVLQNLGMLVMRNIVPTSHPNYHAMRDLYQDYVRRNAYYFGYSSLKEHRRFNLDPTTGTGSCVPIDDITMQAFQSVTWLRGGAFIFMLTEMARLLAGYGSMEGYSSYREYVFKMSSVLSNVDDILDTSGESEVDDVQSGEVHNIFLALALSSYPDGHPLKTEIVTTLKSHVGTGKREDALHVKDLYDRIGLKQKVVEFLRNSVQEFKAVREDAANKCNVPRDLFSQILAHYIRFEDTTEKQEQDSRLQEARGKWGQLLTEAQERGVSDDNLWEEITDKLLSRLSTGVSDDDQVLAQVGTGLRVNAGNLQTKNCITSTLERTIIRPSPLSITS